MAALCRLLLVAACLLIAAGLYALFEHYPYACLLLILIAAWRRAGSREAPTSQGSARMASLSTITRAGLRGDDGWIVGRATLVDPPSTLRAAAGLLSPLARSQDACRAFLAAVRGRPDDGFIRIGDGVHSLVVAPSGAGKTVSDLGPGLLSHPGSCVVVDMKGELFKLSAEHRRKRFGHRIVRVDPLGIAGPAESSDGLNPYDFIDEKSLGFYDDCRALADLLVIEKGTEREPHWNARALDILTTFTAFVCACEADPARRNLAVARDLLASPARFREVVKIMKRLPGCEGVLALLGNNLEWLQGRELGSVLSTLSRHVSWLYSPAVAACLAKSTFDPRWLWSGKVTIYLVLPHDKLTVLASLMRLWLGTLLKLASSSGAGEKHKILFLIDEAAALGQMKPLEDACTQLRGYGIQLRLYVQSLDQLRKCYGDSASIIVDNMMTQQYFGITSLDTADHLSKRIGDATILVESINKNASNSRQASPMQTDGGTVSRGEGYTISEQARRLLKPEEILVLPSHVGLVFHKNLPVLPVELVRYYDAPEFARGGTGKQRRLGCGAVLLACVLLAVSLIVASLLAALPSSEALRRVAFAPATPAMIRMMRRPPGVPARRPIPANARTARPGWSGPGGRAVTHR